MKRRSFLVKSQAAAIGTLLPFTSSCVEQSTDKLNAIGIVTINPPNVTDRLNQGPFTT